MPQSSQDKIRILIVGAGKAGELIGENIARNADSPFQVIGYVDDDKKKQGKKVSRYPVLGYGKDLGPLCRQYNIEEVFIAIPSERGNTVRAILENTLGMKLVYKILPRSSEVLMQDFKGDYMQYVRKLRLEDLLGGEISKAEQGGITSFAKNQTIMITGAAGSIGSELSRQLAAHKPKKIIFYDWWENGMFNLLNELVETYPKGNFEFVIGDVRDRHKLNQVMKAFRPTTVFHAAAYKHVPLMEENGAEAIKNNIMGTKAVAETAVKYKVGKFILVSSDKAVNPTNIMGATKRAAEMVIHILSESQSETTLCSVRFGNVINSNGSVLPTFVKQIEKGGPVTVTHRDVTRFFMTIPEAVHLILQSWVMGVNNDLFVLDMGEPVKIYELAKLLISFQGYEPEKDIKIKIVGLRPGEKLFEEVLVDEEETNSTAVKKIFRTKNYMSFDKLAFLNNLNLLVESLDEDGLNVEFLKGQLQQMISTYKPVKASKAAK
jgi:FlaA1/EpsC-like NDP-sugar epimerase